MEDVSHSRRCMQTSSIKREAKEENSIQSLIMEIDNLNQNLPPGFRFHPTDEELVAYYLHTKLSDHGFSPYAIADVDFNKSEPWDLPGKQLRCFIIHQTQFIIYSIPIHIQTRLRLVRKNGTSSVCEIGSIRLVTEPTVQLILGTGKLQGRTRRFSTEKLRWA